MPHLIIPILARLAFAAALSAPPPTDPAEWAPADALFFVGADDSRALLESVRKTSGMRLLEDKDAAEIAGAPGAMLKKFRERLAAAVDVAPEQLESPFAGPAALYVTVAEGKSLADASAVAVLSVGDRDRLATYYSAAVRKLKDASSKYESISAGSYSIDTFVSQSKAPAAEGAASEHDAGDEGEAESAPDEDDADPFGMAEQDVEMDVEALMDRLFSADAMPASLAACLTEDRLIVARGVDDVKSVLRREGRSGTLAESDDYRAVARHFEKPGRLRWLVNVPRLIEQDPAEHDDGRRLAAALGVKSMGSIVGHASFNPDGPLEYRIEMLWLRRGEATGLMKLLCMKNGPVAPPAFITPAAPMFVTLHIDPPALLDEIERMVRAYDPNEADRMRASLEEAPTPDGDRVNLRKELFGNLRPPLTLQIAFSRPAGARSARLLASIGHRDRAAIERLLGMNTMSVARDAQGTQIYDMSMFGVSLAASADTLFVGTTAAVEAALTSRDSDGLSSDSAFRRTSESLPGEGWGTFYLDTRRLMESLLDMLDRADEIHAAGISDAAGMFALSMAEGMLGEGRVKPDKLRAALKYYAPGMFTLDTTAAGLRGTWASMKPERE